MFLQQAFVGAAVDVDVGAGDVCGGLGGEERDRGAELAGLAQLAGGHGLGHGRQCLFGGGSLGSGVVLGDLSNAVGFMQAGQDGVDGDAVGG